MRMFRNRWIILGLLFMLVVATLTLDRLSPAQSQGTVFLGKIGVVLRRHTEDPGEMFVLAGGNPNAQDIGPGDGMSWMPDGSRLAYNLKQDNLFRIYAANANGQGAAKLSQGNNNDISPEWSPDGKSIVYVARAGDQYNQADIYVMNADGSNPRQLTKNTFADDQPTWSPDGKHIAFVTALPFGQTVVQEIFVMNADGSGLRQLTRSAAGDLNGYSYLPVWSPTGAQIAFLSTRDNARYLSLYVMNADGTGLVRLLDLKANVGIPAWSPDGTRIVFNGNPTGQPSGIYVVQADGTGLKRLADGKLPAWSPDGTQIAFVYFRDYNEKTDQGTIEIHAVGADGTNPRMLASLGQGSIFASLTWSK